jgi:hypothetical protein
MGWRFYRRIRLIPGLRLNLSRSGPSLSFGHRGAWYTIGPRGRRVTVGLPGAGIFYTEHIPPPGRFMAGIVRIRPQAWPNLQMIAFADELLDRGGRLIAAVAKLYAHNWQRARNSQMPCVRVSAGGKSTSVLARKD